MHALSQSSFAPPSSRDVNDAEARFSMNLARFSVESQNFAVLALRYFPMGAFGAVLIC